MDNEDKKNVLNVLEKNGGICSEKVQKLIREAINILQSGEILDRAIRFNLKHFLFLMAFDVEKLQRQRHPEPNIPLENIKIMSSEKMEMFMKQLNKDLGNRPPGRQPKVKEQNPK